MSEFEQIPIPDIPAARRTDRLKKLTVKMAKMEIGDCFILEIDDYARVEHARARLRPKKFIVRFYKVLEGRRVWRIA